MPVFQKGNFSINLGFLTLSGELDEADRQCAWELYTEIVTRVAVRGKVDKDDNDVFDGEIISQSLDSLYSFFSSCRDVMKRYPVGRIGASQKNHLGFFIAQMLEVVIRPFLEKWQGAFRNWWRRFSDGPDHPFEQQKKFPQYEEMLKDWSLVRRFCRKAAVELADAYSLVNVLEIVPPEIQTEWQDDIRRISGENGCRR